MTAKSPVLRPDPQYLKAFATIMSRVERALGPKRPTMPVIACVAGGAALHFYTGTRVSKDIDAKVMARALLDPQDLHCRLAREGQHRRERIEDSPGARRINPEGKTLLTGRAEARDAHLRVHAESRAHRVHKVILG